MDKKIIKEEILKINHLINYNRSKTLNENLLVSEQWGDYNYETGNPFSQGETQSWNREVDKATGGDGSGRRVPPETDAIIDFLTDPHFLLPIAGIVLSIASFGAATPLAAGLLAAGGIGFELADAALYWHEGEYANAGMVAIFTLIPGAQLARMLGLRFVGEMTEYEIKQFLRKINDGAKLTAREAELARAIARNEAALTRVMLKKASRALSVKLISEYSGIQLWTIALELAKAGLLSWRTTYKIAKIGGAFYGLYTLGEIGAFLGDETAIRLGYDVPTEFELNRDAVFQELIDQADDTVKPQLEETFDQLTSVDDQTKQENLNVVLTDIDKKLAEIGNPKPTQFWDMKVQTGPKQ